VAALGLSLVLGIMGIINVAHSAFIMLGAFFALEMLEQLHVDPGVSFVLSIPFFFVVGVIVFRVIVMRMERTEQNQGLVAMFGLMVLIENIGTIFWTTNTRIITVSYSYFQLHLGSLTIPAVRAVAGLLALLAYLFLAHPQSFLLRGAAGTLAMIAVCAAATRWVKVSLHLAFATLAATTLLLLGSPAGWVVAVLIPALAWSRLTLARHKPAEVVLGFVIGVVTGLTICLA